MRRPLTESEIEHLVHGYTAGEVPEAEMVVFLKDVCEHGLNEAGTVALALAMMNSGRVLDLESRFPHTVDKHSTGGVGDKVTLVAVPIAVACGAYVLKLSGRSLGHTGGTVDKLESIPGYRAECSLDELLKQVGVVGGAMAAQSSEIVPADKKMYALRDRTGTMGSAALIAASVMSKKLAVGASCIVIDVKYGSGAFMKTLSEAQRLAESMTAIGRHSGKNVRCLLTPQEAPLGRAVGNALEVGEALSVLAGRGPDDVTELSVTVAAEMILGRGLVASAAEALGAAGDALDNSSALRVFEAIVRAQGGDIEAFRLAGSSGKGLEMRDKKAVASGYMEFVNSEAIGLAAQALAGGRGSEGRVMEPGAGLLFQVGLGEAVEAGQTWVRMVGSEVSDFRVADEHLEQAVRIVDGAGDGD